MGLAVILPGVGGGDAFGLSLAEGLVVNGREGAVGQQVKTFPFEGQFYPGPGDGLS